VAQEKQGIWMISVIGATLKKMRDDAHDAALSHDGSRIVFKDANTNDVFTMNADGSQATLLFKHLEGFRLFTPTWFYNGKRIIYVKTQVSDSGSTITLESRDLKGENPVAVLSNPHMTDFFLAPDGRLIYSLREQWPNEYDTNLWELRVDEESGRPKSEPRRLTDWTGFYFGNPELTADGTRFVFLNGRSQSDVYLGELANGGAGLKSPQRLTLTERVDWPGGWSPDGKTLFLYSDRNGSFDIYKQSIDSRNAEPIATGPEAKWAPQASPDGKWILFMQWPKAVEGAAASSGKLMRVPASGGPAETVMDIKGRPGIFAGGDPTNTIGGFPSFRCPSRGGGNCVLAEKGDSALVLTAFDPVQGRKTQVAKVSGDPDNDSWDLSPDGSRIAVSIFDYKAGDLQIVPLNGGTTQKLNAMPWTELSATAWSADGKSLFLGSYSSRGSSIVHMPLTGAPKLLFKQPSWDIFSLVPSPDGRYLAFGPIVTTANAWTIPTFPSK
jgi:Tol biopolymer transport system component